MLGRAGYPNLWMNLGQGSLGFTLAAGSAVVLGAEGAFFITIGKQFPALGALEQLHKSIPP